MSKKNKGKNDKNVINEDDELNLYEKNGLDNILKSRFCLQSTLTDIQKNI